MKHASAEALDRLEPLILALRESGTLKERSRGVFYFKSKAFLHFHEDPAGPFADVRVQPRDGVDRLPVDDDRSGAALLEIVRMATDPGW